VGALMLLCQPAIADDLDDLKATHQKFFMAANAGDVETMFAILDDKMVKVVNTDSFPKTFPNKEVKERIKQMYIKWYETHSVQVMWHKTDFRVIGNTGLVWGLAERTEVNKKSGIAQKYFNKNTSVYLKSDGKWTLVLIHASPIPQTQTLY
jgi:ketosteroid isomerase-like protein